MSEDNPYLGIAHPNYQKFRKKADDPSDTLQRRIREALETGKLADLQKVFRESCSKDGTRFLVETRLIGKVIKRIQETALAELREAAQQMDLKTCERIQEQVKTDATLAPLAKSREYAKIFSLMEISEACKKLDFKGRGKKEPVLAKQEMYLNELRQALAKGEAAGLAAKDTAFGREIEEKATKKIKALARLQKAVQTKDDKEMLAAIEELESCGFANGDLTKMKVKCLQSLLDATLNSDKIEELRRILNSLVALDCTIKDPDKMRQGWKKVCKADIIAAAQGSSAAKLRAAIDQCQEKRVDDVLSDIIAQASQRLPELERKEVNSKQSIARLEVAVYGRDVAQIQAWLAEARKAGAPESLLTRANAVLCEDSLQKAISDRNGPRLEHLIKEGQLLAVDPSVLDCALRILEQDDPKAAVMLRLSDAMSRKDTATLRDALEDARALGVDESRLAEAVKIVKASGQGVAAAKRAAPAPTAVAAPKAAPAPAAPAAAAAPATPTTPAASSAASLIAAASPELRRSVSFSDLAPEKREFVVEPVAPQQDADLNVGLDELEDDFAEGDEEEDFAEGDEEEEGEFDEAAAEAGDFLDEATDGDDGMTF